jgi:WD40 repeat protein
MAVKVSLISTSTDGKILVWRYSDMLRYPIKGHLLSTKSKGEASISGGTALDKVNQIEDNTYIVGTEGGSIYKCTIQQPSEQDVSHLVSDKSGLRWKPEALAVLANLSIKGVNEVRKRVERYAQDKGENEIQVQTIFNAKPDIKLLFPSPFTANYERHMGPVTSCHFSPFLKRLFLTCSIDGAVRMYDVLNNRPVATFEPGFNEYLMQVAWSPYRPTVFVTVSSTGTVYIYDLLLAKQTPSYILPYTHSLHQTSDISSSSKTAYSLSFNPRQRDFLAVGFHDGTARIFQLNYSLST